jgi:NADH-quinone oxidoreductase subunit H
MDWLSNHAYAILGLLLPVAMPLIIFQLVPLLVVVERRGAAFVQDRPGPNRAKMFIPPAIAGKLPAVLSNLRLFGIPFTLTDLVKLLFKEDFRPPFRVSRFYMLAPAIPVICALLTPAVIPWFATIPFLVDNDVMHPLAVAGSMISSESGLLLLFAFGSLSVYGIVLGSWSSNSKFSLLGGMRSSAMMISYEVSMGLSVLGLLLLTGSFDLSKIVEWQGTHTWGIVVQPIGFLLFLVSMFAECNRNPFDVAEGESEIVGGFHTEYAGVKFMMFMTAEYLHMLVASALLATLYLGGYQILPFPVPTAGSWGDVWNLNLHLVTWDTDWLKAHLGGFLAFMLVVGGCVALYAARLISGRRANYAKQKAADQALRQQEYGLYIMGFAGAGVAMLVGALLSYFFLHTAPINQYLTDPATGQHYWPLWVNLLTAFVQFNILLGKMAIFAWLFVWVRWTLPRFRYDQIMALGWKIMLNIALVNLLVTAVVAKAVTAR